MSETNQRPPPWRNSTAKAHLRQLLESGTIDDNMPPREVVKMSDLFEPYKANFAKYLRSLKNTLAKEKEKQTLTSNNNNRTGHNQPSAQPSARPPPWKNSEAKAHLRTLLLEGGPIKTMNPADAFKLSELFKPYKARFADNFKRLRRTVQEDKEAALFDETALKNDQALYPTNPLTPWGYPRWQGSGAEELMKNDVKNGQHMKVKPRKLQSMEEREPYRIFPLAVIRGHIYQEKRSQVETSYWLSRKKEEQKKKEKKN
jgi:hypothetical protein